LNYFLRGVDIEEFSSIDDCLKASDECQACALSMLVERDAHKSMPTEAHEKTRRSFRRNRQLRETVLDDPRDSRR